MYMWSQVVMHQQDFDRFDIPNHQETLRLIEQNGSTLTTLLLGDGIRVSGMSYSNNIDDYARLSTSIQ